MLRELSVTLLSNDRNDKYDLKYRTAQMERPAATGDSSHRFYECQNKLIFREVWIDQRAIRQLLHTAKQIIAVIRKVVGKADGPFTDVTSAFSKRQTNERRTFYESNHE